jgi:hypothetical protein
MQYAVLDKVNPIITKHQALLVQRQSNTRCSNENCNDTRHQLLSGIDQGLYNLSMDNSGEHEAERRHDTNAETVAEEEQQAFRRHFQNIAVGRFHQADLLCKGKGKVVPVLN